MLFNHSEKSLLLGASCNQTVDNVQLIFCLFLMEHSGLKKALQLAKTTTKVCGWVGWMDGWGGWLRPTTYIQLAGAGSITL